MELSYDERHRMMMNSIELWCWLKGRLVRYNVDPTAPTWAAEGAVLFFASSTQPEYGR